jgi:chromosomal replication initiator protein
MHLTKFRSRIKESFVIPGIRNLKIESQLNANYSFDNFLEGDANRLARSAGMAVANKPGGTSFNPLLIFGGVGLGKTHLAHAIGVEIKDKYPEKQFCTFQLKFSPNNTLIL